MNAAALRAILVDDEGLARRGLKIRLDQLGGVEVIGECKNGREAIALISADQPDVVFLDIQMPGMDGFDVVRELQADNMPMIVFVTAFDQYAVNAFDVHAVDYVLKPVDEDRLRAAVDKVREQLDQKRASDRKQQLLELIMNMTGKSEQGVDALVEGGGWTFPEKLTIRDGDQITIVPVADIDWVDAAGDYMCVHAGGQTHVMRITMKDLERQLDPSVFQRIHRSTLININRIVKLISHINGEFFVTLSSGARLKMSRTYKDKVRQFIA
jgi:two-component system LytT family response regulator